MTADDSDHAELVGRASELDLLRELVGHLRSDGAALMLAGQPGVGKTALLGRAGELAVESGVGLCTVTPSEFDRTTTFTALGKLLGPLRRHVAELPERAATAVSVVFGVRGGPAVRREAVAASTLALLQHAATSQPRLLVVDDAHWLDTPSAEVLAFVGRRLRGSRLGVLTAIRRGARGPLALSGFPERELQPLTAKDSEALLLSCFPQLPPDVRERIVEEADGLPLALLETPLALTSAQRSGREPLPHRLPVTDRVERIFGRRIQDLPATTRSVLLRAALLGATGELPVIRAASPEDPDLAGLAAAEAAGLIRVREVPPRVEFIHPLARATVVHQATPEERRAAHRSLARASPLDSAAHAWHSADAVVGPDEAVAVLLEQLALRTIALGDVTGAMTALQRAADLSADRAQRARREVQAAFVGADVTGDLNRAAELLHDAERLEPALTGSLAATVSASYVLLNGQCDLDTAHRLLVRAIEDHPGRDDATDPHLSDALHLLLILSWFGGRESLWEPFERATSRLGDAVPADLQLCHRSFGDPVRLASPGIPELESTLAGLTGELDPIRITRLALAGVYTDRLSLCREALWRVVDDGRRGGAVALAINALVSTCVDDWLTGQWDEALELAAEGGRLSDRHGYRRYSVILGGYIDQLVHICRGDLDDGVVAAEEMSQWAAERGAGLCSVFALHLRALRAIALEDFEAAYAHASLACPPGRLPPYSPHVLWMLFDVAEAAVRTGRRSAAQAHAEAVRAAGIDRLSPRLAMLTLGCTALALEDVDESVDAFTSALADPATGRWPFDRARIQLSFGELLRRERRYVQARDQLRQVIPCLEQLGARPWLRRAERELRAAGEAVNLSTLPAGPALTAQEQQVAQLAASGLTNREIGERLFLSHRTVGAVLYRLYPKLGVTSRAALRGALDARSRTAGSDSGGQ